MILLPDFVAIFPEAKALTFPRTAVAGVTADSREAAPGWVFVAIRGVSGDGHAFIQEVRKRPGVFVIAEDPACGADLVVGDSRLALALLADGFFGHPSRGLKMVGVTGTSGKTTTTFLLEALLTEAGERVGVIGTVNFRFGTKVYPSTHTTPGPVELQRLLAEMRSDGCTAVVMEVSSHALKQRRVAGVAFDAMVFTNLSPEHLDFHPDMEDYFRSKELLFTECARHSLEWGKHPVAVLNADDDYGRRFLRDGLPGLRRLSYGIESTPVDVGGEGLRVTLSGIEGIAAGVEVRSPLTGRFNAYNLLAALAAARGLGLTPEQCARGIARLKAVPGRLEAVPNSRGIHVLVDYAHKSDALEKVLLTLRDMKGAHRLITVFGCGGDRDRAKRPVMGRTAAELSDHVYVTSDNPRTEDPQAIIQEIMKGMSSYSNYDVQPDRRQAIFSAISAAKSGDVVLIAGKGHEDYQIIGKTKIHFDDREVAREALEAV